VFGDHDQAVADGVDDGPERFEFEWRSLERDAWF
jgi:hypothetical protein